MITIETADCGDDGVNASFSQPLIITLLAAELLNEADQVVRANVAPIDSFPPQETKVSAEMSTIVLQRVTETSQARSDDPDIT